MSILTLKLILAPIIIGSASLAGRRWGPAVSGWLIGLPLTSGPVALFVALSHGETFAASTVLGTLSGGISLVAFSLAYTWLAVRFKWPVAMMGGLLVFAALTILMQELVLSLLPLFALVMLTLVAGLWLMPNGVGLAGGMYKPGRWDIPARILIGTSFILLLTEIAPLLGARLTGLLSIIPLYTGILTVFAHRHHGPAGAASVLRGFLLGLFSFTGFYLILWLLLEHAGIGVAFTAATLTSLTVQGVSFLILPRVEA